MKPPGWWIKARDAWLRSIGRDAEFSARALALASDRDKTWDERQEMLDEEFGVTYEALRPFIEPTAPRRRKGSGDGDRQAVDGGEPSPPVAAAPEGDLGDVRWALSNLGASVRQSDAPSPIAWSLLALARSGGAGAMKLLDIYRATIVQPAVQAASRVDADADRLLDELLDRLMEGIDEDPAPDAVEPGVAPQGGGGGKGVA